MSVWSQMPELDLWVFAPPPPPPPYKIGSQNTPYKSGLRLNSNKSTIFLLNSIFRTTPEVSGKFYFVSLR